MILISKAQMKMISNIRIPAYTISFILIVLSLTLYSCEQLETPTGKLGAKDVTAPSITITSPQNNSTAKDSLIITFETQDDIGIQNIYVTRDPGNQNGYLSTTDHIHYTYIGEVLSDSGHYTYTIHSVDYQQNTGLDSIDVNIQPVLRTVPITGTTSTSIAINTIAASNDSTVWFATNKGLVKYSSGTCTLNPGGFVLTRPLIRSIAIDSHGTVWVPYQDNNNYLTQKLISFNASGIMTVYNYATPPSTPTMYYAFAIDNNDTLWGIFRSDLYDGYIKMKSSYTNSSFFPTNTSGVTGMAIDNYNKKYFILSNQVRVLDGATWTYYNSTNSAIPAGTIKTITRDKNGKVWINIETTTNAHALATLEGTTWVVYNGYPSYTDAFAFDNDGTIWFSGSYYLWHYNGTTLIRRIYLRNASTLYCDNRNNIWIGTGEGLLQYNPNGI